MQQSGHNSSSSCLEGWLGPISVSFFCFSNTCGVNSPGHLIIKNGLLELQQLHSHEAVERRKEERHISSLEGHFWKLCTLILLLTHWQDQEMSYSEYPDRNQRGFFQDEGEKKNEQWEKLEVPLRAITGPQVEIIY